MSARPSPFSHDRPARRNWFRLGLVAALLLVVLGFTVITALNYFAVAEVPLPDVTGLQHEEATRLLRERELEPESYPENVPGAAVGEVTSQAPRGGTIVRRGRRVAIGVHTPPEATRTPRLVGLPLERASRLARDANLPVTRVSFSPDDAPAQRVIAQQPEPGTVLEPGEGLELVVSRGAQTPEAPVPDLVGLELDEARRELRALGFRQVEAVPSSLSFDRPNAVNAQFPPPGEAAPVSTAVTLYYALPGREIVRIPELEGVPVERAQLLLHAAGLELGEVTFVSDPDAPPGVREASPGAYTVRGSPVALVVNGPQQRIDRFPVRADDPALPGATPDAPAGARDAEAPARQAPADGSRQVPFAFDPAELGVRALMRQDYRLRLVVEDERGERTVVDRTVPAGEAFRTMVPVYGDALLQTFINDVFFQAWNP